jgi:hypothetical protein
MAEGTPISSLETGNVADKADNALMSQILAEIGNAGGNIKTNEEIQTPSMAAPPMIAPPMGGIPTYSPHEGMQMHPPAMMHMPPGYMYPTMPVGRNNPDYDEDDEDRPKQKQKVKKNFASSLLDFIREPFFVGIILVVLSFPVLHTHIAKYVPTLYSAGGMLSWFGLSVIGLLGAILFSILRFVSSFF